jgi:hypothetical protein
VVTNSDDQISSCTRSRVLFDDIVVGYSGDVVPVLDYQTSGTGIASMPVPRMNGQRDNGLLFGIQVEVL